jgi:AcrR family transcriptional regulator
VSTGRPQDPARDIAILDAALELIAEVGYVPMTVDAVATRAGTSKATIYRRWANKKEIVLAAVARHRADQSPWSADTGTLREDLLAHAGHFAEVLRGYDGRLAVGLVQARSSHPELIDELELQFSSGARLSPAVIERAVRRGELSRPADHELFEEVVASVMFMRWLRSGSMDADFLEHVVDDLALPVIRHAAGGGHPSS